MSKFWGLTVNVGKRFKQQVQEPFCISGAAVEPIDLASGQYDDKPIQLYLQDEDNDHLLCSLHPKQGILQVPLNVRIGSSETVGFHLKGGSQKSKVHLTGYTLPRDISQSPGMSVPFKGQRKSILVTEPKSDDKDRKKKRVSIVETEAYGEVEMESSEDEDENRTPKNEALDIQNELRKKLFNGSGTGADASSFQLDSDEDDDDESEDDQDEEEDDDDEEEDSDMGEEEKNELSQLSKKGKYDPKTGGKLEDGKDSDSDLELLDDDDDEDLDDTDSDEMETSPSKSKSPSQTPSPAQGKKQNSENASLQKQKQGATPTPTKGGKAEAANATKTPENKNLKLKTPSSAGHTPMKAFSKGGVLVNEITVGNGSVAKHGKMVAVYYRGRLKSNNKQFDASVGGPPFKFRLGKGEVIRGWDLGVEGMKVGGKRRLTIPAQLAYGKKGAPPDIPPNSTLVFEVELKNVF